MTHSIQKSSAFLKLISIISIILAAAVLLSSCGAAASSSAASSTASSAAAQSASSEADDELAEIQKTGKFIVGIEGTYPPYTYHDDNGELVGYDIELAKAIAEKLGAEAEFVEASWDSLLAGVDSGRFDTVINNVSVTEERAEKYDFSDPYLYMGLLVVVKDDNDSIHSIEDFDGKIVANNATNAYATQLNEQGATILPIDTADDAASMVLTGRADFTTFGPAVYNDYLTQHPDAALKVAFEMTDPLDKAAVPVRKGEQRLLDAINEALTELRDDGTLAELSERYFGADYTQEP